MVTRYIKDAFLYGAGDTVVGQVRKANEDNCGYRKTVNGDLFVVCDGMGGHVGGATASRIAVDSILDYVAQHPAEDKRVVLKDALMFANMQILGAAAQDPTLKGMGTTACIALVDAQNIWIAHVGDSRIYLYSENEKYLYRITKDHSLVQGLVDKGELDDREAEHHPQKNIILRALGTKPDLIPEVDSAPVRAQVGDIILICSDGLCGMIDDNEIEAILKKSVSLEDEVQMLIDAANIPGKGKDNITVQLIQVQSSMDNLSSHPNFNPNWRQKGSVKTPPVSHPNPPKATSTSQTKSAPSKKRPLIIALVSVLVAGLFATAISYKYFGKRNEPKEKKSAKVEMPAGTSSGSEEATENAQADAAKAQADAAKAKAEADAAKAKAEADAAKAKAEADAAIAKAQADAAKAKAEADAAKAKAEADAAKAKAEADAAIAKAEAEAAKAKAEADAAQSKETTDLKEETQPQEDKREKQVEDTKSNNSAEDDAIIIGKKIELKRVGNQRNLADKDLFPGGLKENVIEIDWQSNDPEFVGVEKTDTGRSVIGKKKGSAIVKGLVNGKEKYRIEVIVKKD